MHRVFAAEEFGQSTHATLQPGSSWTYNINLKKVFESEPTHYIPEGHLT